jgi:hypothetical protein
MFRSRNRSRAKRRRKEEKLASGLDPFKTRRFDGGRDRIPPPLHKARPHIRSDSGCNVFGKATSRAQFLRRVSVQSRQSGGEHGVSAASQP